MAIGRLEGKVAIITGGARGIGEAAARLFTSHGALVVIADIQDSLGLSVAASIGPDKCTYRHCDVADETQVSATVDYTVELHGRLDIMFSNAAAFGKGCTVLDMDMVGELDHLMAVNVRGAANAIKHAARVMVEGKIRGSIVCTASVTARLAGVGSAAYTVSKHALVGLVKAAAGELGGKGIRVNCVSPFGVATANDVAEGNGRGTSILKGVVLKGKDVAEAALFLASEEAAFVSGLDLVVDGAFTSYRVPV